MIKENPPAIVETKDKKDEIYTKVFVDSITVNVPFVVKNCIASRNDKTGAWQVMAVKSETYNGKEVKTEVKGWGYSIEEAIKDFKKKY